MDQPLAPGLAPAPSTPAQGSGLQRRWEVAALQLVGMFC